MTCIHHYSFKQNSFTVLKTLSTPLIHPSCLSLMTIIPHNALLLKSTLLLIYSLISIQPLHFLLISVTMVYIFHPFAFNLHLLLYLKCFFNRHCMVEPCFFTQSHNLFPLNDVFRLFAFILDFTLDLILPFSNCFPLFLLFLNLFSYFSDFSQITF